jgi:ankyrin repeat protein
VRLTKSILALIANELQNYYTPLHLASWNGHLEVVRYLIEKCRAEVNTKDNVSEFDCLIQVPPSFGISALYCCRVI